MYQNTFKHEPQLNLSPHTQFSSPKNMNCSCVKVCAGRLNVEYQMERRKDRAKGLACLLLAAVRLCHLLTGEGDKGKCVHSDTWAQIDGERWPSSISIAE